VSLKTNGFTLLTLFVRLAALYFFVNGMLKVVELGIKHYKNDETLFQQDIYYFLIVVVFFVFFWLFADVVAKFALARKDAEFFESAMPPSEWAKLLFGGLGVWFGAWALIDLAYYVPYFFDLRAIGENDPNWIKNEFIPGIVSTLCQLMIGLSLFFGSSGLTRLFQQYRHYGVSSTPEPAETPEEQGGR